MVIKEIWKDIKGYEGLYQISNLGRVKKLQRTIITKNNRKLSYKEMILKPTLNSKGYCRVELIDITGNRKRCFVHRLVAFEFCDKQDNCNVVNHKDCNPLNNNYQNLEWVTQKENMQYSIGLNRKHYSKEWYEQQKGISKCKPIKAINIKTGEVKHYNKIASAVSEGFQGANINKCCRGIRKSHKGYKWEYEEA